jgi:predicted secreted protein
MRALLLATAFSFLSLSPAFAQQEKGPLDLPPGQSIVHLSASERVEVEQDELVANLRYEAENKDAKALQNEINTVMKKAVDAAKAVPGVEVTTEQYYVYLNEERPQPLPNTPEDRQPKPVRTWRGNQGLTLTGKSADALLDLTGKLQEMGLAMNGLNYQVSSEKMEETKDSLLEAALLKLRKKAERVAKALGKGESELREVSVDSNENNFVAPRAMMAMAADAGMAKMAAPVASPGKSEVSLSVSALALLKP